MKPTFICLVVALVTLLPVACLGQSTLAQVVGTISDGSGAAVPDAQVTAFNEETGLRYMARSNSTGNYTVALLPPGTYRLNVQKEGFQPASRSGIVLTARDVRRVDLRLEIGTVEVSVEVSAGVAMIETETARISDIKTAGALQSLPMNTRGVMNFTLLSPGVLQAGGGSSTFRFAGSRANQWDRSIDGISIGNGIDATSIGPLNAYNESFQEVRIDMANNTSEFGVIGQVTIISKSGTNQPHGSLFDYYSTPWFRARSPFSLARTSGITHNPGGSIGGPLLLPRVYDGHNRTFFFFSFETARGSAIQQLLNPTVPLQSWREGDFSALASSTTVRDPYAGNTPFPNNRIPVSRINTVAQRIQERFYPLPNYGDTSVFKSQNYRELMTREYDPSTYWTTRLDHRFSDRSFVYGRFTWYREYARSYESNLPTVGRGWRQRDCRGFTLTYSHMLRPNLLNEFRYGFAYNNNPRNGPLMGKQIVEELGLQGLADNLPDINGTLTVAFSGLGLTGVSQTAWMHPGFKNWVQQFQEHLSWFRGRHNLKIGTILSPVTYENSTAASNLFGSVSFSNRFTGYPYSDFLLGIPTSSSRGWPPVLVQTHRWASDFFFTDELKISRRLTLNLGLRYEYHPSATEASGRQAVFDVGTGKILVPDGSLNLVSSLMPVGYVEVAEASQANLPQSLIRTDRNNLAPRFGLAFRPFGNRTVMRAGYGIFYDVVPASATAGGVPYEIAEPTYTNPSGAPTVVLPRVYPVTTAGPATVTIPAAVRSDLRTPYSMQYNFTLEHQRWDTGFRLSYIGTNTRQGEWTYNINQPVGDSQLYVDKPRMFSRYPAISYRSNGAGHQYHSLTVEVDRPLAKGLYYQVAYVLARDIGDLERGESSEDAYNRQRERSVWTDIPTHRLTSSFTYQLPFGKGRKYLSTSNRVLSAVTSGWQLSGIYFLQSGQFLTPYWTGPDPVGTAYTTGRTPAQVTLRPNQLWDANLPASQRSPNHWFDTSAFSAPTTGYYGTSAKGVIKGPGCNTWHAAVVRHFSLYEHLKLRWELEATNVANHPNWSNPATNISSLAQAGVISGIGGVAGLEQTGARSFRMSLKLEF